MSQPHLPESLQIKMNRKGFGLKKEIEEELKLDYHSDLIEDLKANHFTKTFGDLTIHLAQEFGFCYGVDRAVELAYETRKRFPEKKIFLTTEIIHNPLVNGKLSTMGIQFLSGPYQNAELEDVNEKDVVIVPAFGTTVDLLKKLTKKKCELVDTICASVIVVWKRVEKYAQEGFTVLVHGKAHHEETEATTSRVTEFPNGQYLVVLNKTEAEYVCNSIINGVNREEFSQKFKNSTSPNFNPEIHLQKIGLANQTTMLSSESREIGEMVKQAMITKFGAEKISEHYRAFDTICNATQERQDAVLNFRDKKVDTIIVIGGYNSSNTNHLCEIAETIAPTYHIDRPECLVSATKIRHKPFGQKEEKETVNWMKNGAVSIGITAGASTPNQVMGRVLEKLIEFKSNIS